MAQIMKADAAELRPRPHDIPRTVHVARFQPPALMRGEHQAAVLPGHTCRELVSFLLCLVRAQGAQRGRGTGTVRRDSEVFGSTMAGRPPTRWSAWRIVRVELPKSMSLQCRPRRRLRRRGPAPASASAFWERPGRRAPAQHLTRHQTTTIHAACGWCWRCRLPQRFIVPSRPPRLGRSLRSRHLRSASPKPKPSDHSPGFGACDEAEELAKRAGLWVTLSIDSGHQRAAPQLGFGNMHSKGTYQVYVTTLLEIIRSASLD